MWHEARKQEKKIRGIMVDFKKRAERRREFYEKIRLDPAQFLQIHGRQSKIHLDANITQAAEVSLMPWRGEQSNLIDRFDVRAHLDFIDDQRDNDSGFSDENDENLRRINYERWRNLVQNEFLCLGDSKVLHQIYLEERFGMNQNYESQTQQNANLKKKLAEKKATIAYNYENEDDQSQNLPSKNKVESSSSTSESDSDEDFDTTINIDTLSNEQGNRLNSLATKYGMKDQDFFKFLEEDKVEAEKIKVAKEIENEKSMFSGRKSRRERRALKERRMMILRANNIEESTKSIQPEKVEASSSSESDYQDVDENKVEFITCFGGSSEDEKDENESKPKKKGKAKQKSILNKKPTAAKFSEPIIQNPPVFGPNLPFELETSKVEEPFFKNQQLNKSRSYRYRSKSRSSSPDRSKLRRKSSSMDRRRRSRERRRSNSRTRVRRRSRSRDKRRRSTSRDRRRSRSRDRRRRSRSRSRDKCTDRRSSSKYFRRHKSRSHDRKDYRSRSSRYERSRSRDKFSRRRSRSRERSNRRTYRRSSSRERIDSRGTRIRRRSCSRKLKSRSRSRSRSINRRMRSRSRARRDKSRSLSESREKKSSGLSPSFNKNSVIAESTQEQQIFENFNETKLSSEGINQINKDEILDMKSMNADTTSDMKSNIENNNSDLEESDFHLEETNSDRLFKFGDKTISQENVTQDTISDDKIQMNEGKSPISKDRLEENESFKDSTNTIIEKAPSPPMRRYYRHDLVKDNSSDSSSDVEEKSETSLSKKPILSPSISSSSNKRGHGNTISSNPQQRLKKRMRALIDKQYKLDKKAEFEKQEKLEQQRYDREENRWKRMDSRYVRSRSRSRSYSRSSSSSSSSDYDSD